MKACHSPKSATHQRNKGETHFGCKAAACTLRTPMPRTSPALGRRTCSANVTTFLISNCKQCWARVSFSLES